MTRFLICMAIVVSLSGCSGASNDAQSAGPKQNAHGAGMVFFDGSKSAKQQEKDGPVSAFYVNPKTGEVEHIGGEDLKKFFKETSGR